MATIEPTAPIYIFQMGKVGSVSVHHTLAQHLPNQIVHGHHLEELPAADQALLQARRAAGLPVYFISPIREPLARNVSAFFQTFKRDTGFEFSDRSWTQAELRELFLDRYPHDEGVGWFDDSFRPALGIDVYAEPFPKEKKWAVYTTGAIKVLVYRIDLGRQEQLQVVSDFVGCKLEQWTLGNLAEDKAYAEPYRVFCNETVLPEEYIARMSRTKFCRHFWTDAEMQAHADKWRAREAGRKPARA